MPNGIKYSTSPQTQALKKGNYWIGTGDVDKSPTSTTGYWNTIVPPTGGYSIYVNKAADGPSIFQAANDTQLIYWTQTLSGTTFPTGPSALDWYNSQTDKMVANIDYPAVITNGISVLWDAGYTPSFPKGGTSWYDIGPSGFNVSLINGPTWSTTSGGIISFDGTDDAGRTNYALVYPGDFCINFWVNFSIYKEYQNVMSSAQDGNANFGFWIEFGYARGFTFFTTGVQLVVADNVLDLRFLSTGRWYNFCINRISGNVKLYMDNVLAGQNTSNATIGHPSYTVDIGPYAKDSPAGIYNFAGSLSSVQFYAGRGLTTNEILLNYQTMFPRFLGANIVTNGLISYLDAGYSPSYPGSGTTWFDLSGYAANGTLTNGPTYNSANGGSIVFDGSDDFVSLPTTYLPTGKTPKTMEIWMTCDSIASGFRFAYSMGSPSTGGAIFIGRNASTLYYGGYASDMAVSNFFADKVGTILCLTLVYNGTTAFGYYNGSLHASGNYNWSMGSDVFRIGQQVNNFAEFWTGKVYIARVYNRALTATEVLQNFNAQRSRFGI